MMTMGLITAKDLFPRAVYARGFVFVARNACTWQTKKLSGVGAVGMWKSLRALALVVPRLDPRPEPSPCSLTLGNLKHMSKSPDYKTTNIPSRQMGQLVDSSSNQGSTQSLWKRWCPGQGNTRTSSPSSKSTMQIGQVSRPIAAGSTTSDP